MTRATLVLSLVCCSPFTQAAAAQLSWRQLPMPDVRQGAALAYDAPRGVVLMFGGCTDDPSPLNDTWQWDGTRWSQLFPATSPTPRGYHVMVYDHGRGEIVLFGGYNGSGSVNDTWIWRNGTWIEVFPTSVPGARHHAGFSYDAQRGRSVLYGGYSGGNYSDTWEWDGNDWRMVQGNSLPGGRHGHAMAYLGGGRTLLFGGHTGSPQQDTWIWDGTAWTQQPAVANPPPRWHHTLTLDPVRGRPVLFGGWDGSASLSDTWAWTGSTWVQGPPQGPPGRHFAAAAWDGARQELVLLTGRVVVHEALGDTWAYDGAAWQQKVSSPPMYRAAHRMVFDTGRRRAVLFGGVVGWPGSYRPLADTWELNGSSWQQVGTGTAPPARYYHGLAFDAARQVTVLYGGSSAAATLADQWHWNGAAASWSAVSAVPNPGPREGQAMVALANSDIFLFGGWNGAGYDDETWLWNGTVWTRDTRTGGPSARSHAGAAYDPVLDRVVLFGGADGTYRGETWQWTRAQGWTELFPAPAPSGRAFPQLAFSPDEQAVVLYGGEGPGQSSQDTWLLVGSTWVRCVQRVVVPPRHNHAMVYDPVGHRLLSFGGDPGRHGDLWEAFNPTPATVEAFGTSCPSCPPGPTPAFAARAGSLPWRGDTLFLEIQNLPVSGLATPFAWLGVSRTQWLGLPLPLNLPPYPGCSVNSSWDVLFQATRTGTTATITVPIPFDFTLVGTRIYFQGMVVDICNFAPRIGLTNSLDLLIGADH